MHSVLWTCFDFLLGGVNKEVVGLILLQQRLTFFRFFSFSPYSVNSDIVVGYMTSSNVTIKAMYSSDPEGIGVIECSWR